MRLLGFIKVFAVIALDFLVLMTLFDDPAVAGIVVSIITVYTWLGGYISLFKEDAVRFDNLPARERQRLENARDQLIEDVRNVSELNISGLKLYLIPGDDDLQATAYGANCVSVSRGTMDNADPVSLNAVLAHEISHLINLDPEFSRAVFASITLLMAALSVVSFVMMLIIFLVFLALNCFRSWVGVLAFRGTTKFTGGLFGLVQKAVVVTYQTILSLVSRAAEYRCDAYSASLGYGLQLAHFLSAAGSDSGRRLTLTEALYRSHPPTPKRIARLETYVSNQMQLTNKK